MTLVYKCDRCQKDHRLNESKVKSKQQYVPPRSCYEGDYYVHSYYWFPCECGRAIEVKTEHLPKSYSIEKEYTKHNGVCVYQ